MASKCVVFMCCFIYLIPAASATSTQDNPPFEKGKLLEPAARKLLGQTMAAAAPMPVKLQAGVYSMAPSSQTKNQQVYLRNVKAATLIRVLVVVSFVFPILFALISLLCAPEGAPIAQHMTCNCSIIAA